MFKVIQKYTKNGIFSLNPFLKLNNIFLYVIKLKISSLKSISFRTILKISDIRSNLNF